MALELYRKGDAEERTNIFFSLKIILIADVNRAKLWSLVQFICAKAAFSLNLLFQLYCFFFFG